MQIDYHKEHSSRLGRDMEFKVYGHGGKPALVFPCQNGRFFDWEGFGMLEKLQKIVFPSGSRRPGGCDRL